MPPRHEPTESAPLPLRRVGPLVMAGAEFRGEYQVPLATFESPLWPSVERGMRLTARAGGIQAVVPGECMTRSIVLVAPDAVAGAAVLRAIRERTGELAAVVAESSRFARLQDWHGELLGPLLFLRFAFDTADAAGHNMATVASEHLADWLLAKYPQLRYGSLSGNLCTDKKVSAANGLLGRGRQVIAECTIPAPLLRRYLKVTPAELVALNQRKNWAGSMLAGSLRSANAHFANMLLAFYLATGQDAANIVEGSQGFTWAEERDEGLYFSVSLPHLIVGTVGNGKELPWVRENLAALDCLAEREPGVNARRLAVLAAGTVLCGELSLLAALVRPGELVAAHLRLERRASDAPEDTP